MADDAGEVKDLPVWFCSWCNWRSDWPLSSGGCAACAPQRRRRGLPPPAPEEVDTVREEVP